METRTWMKKVQKMFCTTLISVLELTVVQALRAKQKLSRRSLAQHILRYRNDEIQLLLFIYYAKTVHKNIRIYTTNIP